MSFGLKPGDKFEFDAAERETEPALPALLLPHSRPGGSRVCREQLGACSSQSCRHRGVQPCWPRRSQPSSQDFDGRAGAGAYSVLQLASPRLNLTTFHSHQPLTHLTTPQMLLQGAAHIVDRRRRKTADDVHGSGLRRGSSEPKLVLRPELPSPCSPAGARGASTARAAAAAPQEPAEAARTAGEAGEAGDVGKAGEAGAGECRGVGGSQLQRRRFSCKHSRRRFSLQGAFSQRPLSRRGSGSSAQGEGRTTSRGSLTSAAGDLRANLASFLTAKGLHIDATGQAVSGEQDKQEKGHIEGDVSDGGDDHDAKADGSFQLEHYLETPQRLRRSLSPLSADQLPPSASELHGGTYSQQGDRDPSAQGSATDKLHRAALVGQLRKYRRRITTVDVRMLSLAVLSVLLMLVQQSHHLLQLDENGDGEVDPPLGEEAALGLAVTQSVMTCLLLLLMLRYHHLQKRISRTRRLLLHSCPEEPWSQWYEQRLYFTVEALVLLIHPMPGNVLPVQLEIFMWLRLYLILRVSRDYSTVYVISYYNYDTAFSWSLTIKSWLHAKPATTVTSSLLLLMTFTAYGE